MAPKILLVEDEKSLCELICSMFSEQYEVVCVDNGASVFEQFNQKECPQIVLLNYLLPDTVGRPPVGIGLNLLQFIKKKSPQTTVIMFTGCKLTEVAFQAGRLGAFAYVLKPFDVEKLAKLLESAIKHGRDS